MKDKKKMILKFLKCEEKASTKRISDAIKSNKDRALYLLRELESKNKIIMIEETVATYWKINKNYMEEKLVRI